MGRRAAVVVYVLALVAAVDILFFERCAAMPDGNAGD